MRHIALGVAVIGITLAGGSAAMAKKRPNVQPGQWESTIHVQMTGMPVPIPPITTSTCITRKHLVPETHKPGEKCKVLEQKVMGSTVQWKVKCETEHGTVTGTGKVVYSRTTYTGSMDMEMTGGAANGMKMHYAMKGKRVGPCKKKKK